MQVQTEKQLGNNENSILVPSRLGEGAGMKKWTAPELERIADMTGVYGQPGLLLDGLINISQPS